MKELSKATARSTKSTGSKSHRKIAAAQLEALRETDSASPRAGFHEREARTVLHHLHTNVLVAQRAKAAIERADAKAGRSFLAPPDGRPVPASPHVRNIISGWAGKPISGITSTADGTTITIGASQLQLSVNSRRGTIHHGDLNSAAALAKVSVYLGLEQLEFQNIQLN